MADLTWHDDGNYHWCTWSASDSNNYDYHVRLAANSYRNGGGYFNMFSSLPNVNAPSGGEKVAVLNGGIFYSYDGAGYNIGPEVAWYYNVLQENFANESDYLAMGSWGETIDIGLASSIYGNYPLVLGGPARQNGTGEPGCSATTSHAFVGHGGGVNYMGWCTGVSGATCVSKMTGKYGGKCMILDGGGSTQMWYMGQTKRPSSDGSYRNIKNAIVLYRTVKSTDPDEPDDPAVEPIPGEGVLDEVRSGAVASRSYALVNGELKKAKPWYALMGGQLKERPKAIYQMKDGELKPVLLKYGIDFNVYGGNAVSSSDYYYGDTMSFSAPTHANYDGLPVKFWGWFDDSTFTNQISGIGTNATGDKEYFAKWLQYKKQYSGQYYTTSTVKVSFGADSYTSGASSLANIWWWEKNYNTYSSDVVIKKIFANFDYCNSSWNYYRKPKVEYGYYTNPGTHTSFVRVGTLYNEGSDPSAKTVNMTLPAGCAVGLRTARTTDGITRQYAYLYDGSYYTYTGTTTKTADWQDSADPPSGNWASGYPSTRYVQRHFNGSSWTSWGS